MRACAVDGRGQPRPTLYQAPSGQARDGGGQTKCRYSSPTEKGESIQVFENVAPFKFTFDDEINTFMDKKNAPSLSLNHWHNKSGESMFSAHAHTYINTLKLFFSC